MKAFPVFKTNTLGIAITGLLIASSGHASCSSPTGAQGQVTYANSQMQFCDGSAWQSMKGSSVSSCSGTAAGTVRYVSGSDYQFCDGTNWYSMKGASLGACSVDGQTSWNAGATAAAVCISTILYSTKAPSPVCGATWQDLGYVGATPPTCTVGTVSNVTYACQTTYSCTSGGTTIGCSTRDLSSCGLCDSSGC